MFVVLMGADDVERRYFDVWDQLAAAGVLDPAAVDRWKANATARKAADAASAKKLAAAKARGAAQSRAVTKPAPQPIRPRPELTPEQKRNQAIFLEWAGNKFMYERMSFREFLESRLLD